MNERTREITAIANFVNTNFLASKTSNLGASFADYSLKLYKEVQKYGWSCLTDINETEFSYNLPNIGSAFYRMACFINNNDEDINSVCAENAFYCLAKAIKSGMMYGTASHLFCLLQFDKSGWGGRLLKGKKDKVSITMQIEKGSYTGIYAHNFTKVLQFYVISLICDISDNGYAISPSDFWDSELNREDIEDVIVYILDKYPNGKNSVLDIGKYLFEQVYSEIEHTLNLFR